MNFKPNADRLLIYPDEAETVTPSGLLITTGEPDAPQTGRVTAIGPGVDAFKLKDHVLYGKYAGTLVELDGKEYLVIKEADVLGTLTK